MNEPVAGQRPSLASPQPTRTSRLALTWWSALILVTIATAAAYVYYTIFSRFRGYDDEGFILISLKSFFQGKPLYDQVYSMYQPAFYVLHWLFFSLTGAPLGHDSIRLLTLVFWLMGAALNGLIAYRLTRSPLLGFVVGVISVRCLEPFANEPGHPQAMGYVLVATVVALFVFAEELPPRRFATAVGALTGLALLTKINVGVLLLLPTALLFTVSRQGGARRGIKIILSLVMLSLPTALWRSQLAVKGAPLWTLALLDLLAVLVVGTVMLDLRKSWWLTAAGFLVCGWASFETATSIPALPVFNAGLLTLSIGAALSMQGLNGEMAYRSSADNKASGPDAFGWVWALVACGLVVSGILLLTLLRGTTLHGLANGLFRWPARLSTSFLIRPRSNWLGPMLGLTGMAGCYAYLLWRPRWRNRSWFRPLLLVSQSTFGLLVLAEFYLRVPGSHTLMPLHNDLPHFWMLPFAWLVAIPELGTEATHPARQALLLITVMQPLIALPVAGTQLVPASMLIPVLGAVCLGNVLQAMVAAVNHLEQSGRLQAAAAGLGAAAVLFAFVIETSGLRKTYAALTPLNLPGAVRIRLTADEVRVFHQVVAELARPEVESFLTLPGMDSFYFWAQKDPPNSMNVSAWIIMLDASTQEQIWQAACARRGLMAVRNRKLIRTWVGGRSISQLPLVADIEKNFNAVTNYGGYEIMVRR